MNTKQWLPMAAVAVLLMESSCSDWGIVDPPAGNQAVATLENVASWTFDDPQLDSKTFKAVAFDGGELPAVVEDESLGNVLFLNNGYVSVANPLNAVTCQKAASVLFKMKQPVEVDEEGNVTSTQDLEGALFGFTNATKNESLWFTANGMLHYDGLDGFYEDNNPASVKTNYITPGAWHSVALIVRDSGYAIYVDGYLKTDKAVPDFDCSKMVAFMNRASTLYIGAGSDAQTAPWYVDDIKIYRNEVTSKEINANLIKGGGGSDDPSLSAEPVEPIWFNSFDAGDKGCIINGGGEYRWVGGLYGNVFSNAMNGMRQNYLQLPAGLFGQSAETQALTIGVWVNRGNETESAHYNWSPLISAYSSKSETDNGMPMFVCQYRGVLQLNINGWSDYTDAQNVNGVNAVYHNDSGADWLADGEWHYYTATFTPTTAKVYIDGELANAWEIDGVDNTAAGLFSNGSELTHICLGGNQAWNWGDPDPGFWFDDIAFFNQELSQAQIQNIIKLKKQPIYYNPFTNDGDGAIINGGGSFIEVPDAGFGKVFSNAMNGMRQNYLQLPAGLFGQSADTQALSICVWVNRGNETESAHYNWSPLISAYSSKSETENGMPMFICQYRGVLQLNINGWSDYTDAQNVNGVNAVYHNDSGADWLADGGWHFYTATFTPTTANVYLDGELANAWEIDGVDNTAAGLFSNGSELTHICLGGNQAWNWGDPDPGFWFDDIMFYNVELSANDVKQLMLLKQ